MASAAGTQDLIRRAFVNLKSLREHIPVGYVYEESFYRSFNQALDQLQQAGNDVSEWRLVSNAVGETDGLEFKQKIDALLMYFTFQEQKTAIGFNC
jgi:hypothetical protein